MARCELTGKDRVIKNLVSHSNIKTKTVALPNIQQKRIFSKVLNEMVNLKMATSTIRSMEHMGGLDTYILNLPEKSMSKRALDVRRRILRKLKMAKNSKGASSEAKN